MSQWCNCSKKNLPFFHYWLQSYFVYPQSRQPEVWYQANCPALELHSFPVKNTLKKRKVPQDTKPLLDGSDLFYLYKRAGEKCQRIQYPTTSDSYSSVKQELVLHLSCTFHLKKYFFLFPLKGCQTPGENKEKRFIRHQEHSYISKSTGDYCVLFFFCMISRFATTQDGKPFQCHEAKYVLS